MDLQTEFMPRPYGLAGLVLSLFGLAVLAVLVLAGGVFALGLADFLLSGKELFFAHVRALRETPLTDGAGTVELAGFIASSAIYIAIIAAILILARLRGRGRWRDLVAWSAFRPDRLYLWLTVGGLAYGVAASALIGYLHPPAREWFTLPETTSGVIVSCLLVVVLAPLAEELLFRGWVYTALRYHYGFAVALVTTAAIFALAHWEHTHLYALSVLPVGFLLGTIRERSGSTQASALFHAAFNFMGWFLTFLGKA